MSSNNQALLNEPNPVSYAPGHDASQDTSESSQSKRTVWNHFTRMDNHDAKKAKCRYCNKVYSNAGSSTSNMWNHIKRAHPKALYTTPVAGPIELFFGASPSVQPYSHDKFKELLTEWVICDSLPFTTVESSYFRKVVHLLNPSAKVPSRDTLKRDIVNMFMEKKEMVRKILRDAPGRLSFTVDLWTSPNIKSFMGITAHWVDNEWSLKSTIVDFIHVQGVHSGRNLATAFKDVCLDFGILDKVNTITVDNASNNDTFLSAFEALCREEGATFTKKSGHVRCIAHIVNIAMQELLRALKSEAFESEEAYLAASDSDPNTTGCVPKLRRLVVS